MFEPDCLPERRGSVRHSGRSKQKYPIRRSVYALCNRETWRMNMATSTLTVTDNRTGKRYELPIELNAIRTTDLEKIRVAPDQPGLVSYDPALLNTAACKSEISYIDGERGILRYRGYPI